MESRAVAKYLRMSARKARLVADQIRGYGYLEAVDILNATNKKAADFILKVVKSAAANAKYLNPELRENDLYVKKIVVDEGPTLKRFRARARGRAARIRKRTCTVEVILSD